MQISSQCVLNSKTPFGQLHCALLALISPPAMVPVTSLLGEEGLGTVPQHLPVPLCLLHWWKAPEQHLTRGSKTCQSSSFLVGHGDACTMLHSSTVPPLQTEKGLAGLWLQWVDFQRWGYRITFSKAHPQHQENTELLFCFALIYRPGTVLQSMRGERKKK